MYVFLRLELDCSPDDAWSALGNPAVFRAVTRPLIRVRSLDAGGFPKRWSETEVHHVAMSLFGVLPLGKHSIDITYTERPGGVRMVIDQGEPLTGMLSRTSTWDHRMAVSAGPGEKRSTVIGYQFELDYLPCRCGSGCGRYGSTVALGCKNSRSGGARNPSPALIRRSRREPRPMTSLEV